MNPALDTKDAIVLLPQSVGTTEVAGLVLDTLGYDFAQIRLIADTAAASSVLTTLSLAQGEVTNVSSSTAIAAYELGDTTNCEAITAPNTNTGDVIRYDIDCRKYKRYLFLGVASTTARIMAGLATLSRAEKTPTTDALSGCTQIVGP